MNHHIMEWPSQFLYGGVLKAHPTVADHLLKDLPSVVTTPLTSSCVSFIDTSGCGLHERETGKEEDSKGNDGEADIVLTQIRELLAAGVPDEEISVIAPYNLQVDLIKQKLVDNNMSPKIEVHTVDGFQGREKEAVIISFTRSNKKGVIGFLSEQRRTNVAVTRARRHLSLVGDSSTISRDPFIKGLIEYCSNHCDVHSAHEYIHDIEPNTVSSDGCHGDVPLAPPTQPINNDKGRRPPLTSYPELVKQYTENLTLFKDGSEGSVSFTSLTSAQRKALYEASESLELYHTSLGEGKKRVVTITKIKDNSSDNKATPTILETNNNAILPQLPTNDDSTTTQTRQEESVMAGDNINTTNIGASYNNSSNGGATSNVPQRDKDLLPTATDGLWKCSVCGYTVPAANRDLHELRCSREQRQAIEEHKAKSKIRKMEKSKSRDIDKQIADRQKKQSKTKNKGASSGNKLSNNKDDDDLDTMIAEMTLMDNTCRYPGCKKSVSMLGVKCEHCSYRYCMGHMVPEIHGCGVEAKKKAREKILREAESRERGFGGASKKQLDSTKRAQLQRKLDSKIEDMTTDRQRKKKSQK